MQRNGRTSGPAPGQKGMTRPLPFLVRISNDRMRQSVRTTEEALRLIDRELPAELRRLPRWTFARELLEVAARSGKKKDMTAAVRQLTQALSNEGWLLPDRGERSSSLPAMQGQDGAPTRLPASGSAKGVRARAGSPVGARTDPHPMAPCAAGVCRGARAQGEGGQQAPPARPAWRSVDASGRRSDT